MSRLIGFVAIVAFCAANSALHAGGIIQKLPEDGAWIKYFADGKANDQKLSGDVTLRSVGTTFVEGEESRWLEFEVNVTSGGNEPQKQIYKVLVPEKHIGKGKDPLANVIRGWSRLNDGEPQKVTKQEILDQDNGFGAVVALMEKVEEPEPLKEKRTIDFQTGKLECGGWLGKFESRPNQNIKHSGTKTVWTHESMPFGAAAMKLDVSLRNRNDQQVATITLELIASETGTDATSTLPDAK